MPKHPKRPRDTNALAFQLIREATGQAPKQTIPEPSPMAERGRKGGLKGGRKRAKSMTKAERSALAKKAAHKRWGRPTS